ncbi:hypothetical protein ACJ72_08036 [Emergomyces africanus]|uniref:Prp 4 CRoW domain-containing protein n=1 Tax=Emergomyces africanus TaxID=1955775 RepID=A0A1B7NLG4_9EURO|nr:hypothetical protein ACJ72_08036 [Emergomyces africanus]
MHISSILFIASAASAVVFQPNHRMASMALAKLESRQFKMCKPIKRPYSCEKSCGEGYEACGNFPDCYNPTEGESCCTDGSYCPKGFFCTDSGCCPDGSSLSKCNASVSLTASPTASPTPSPGSGGGGDDDLSSSPTPSKSPQDGSGATPSGPFGGNPTPTPTPGAASKMVAQTGLIVAGLGLLAFL